MGDFIPNLVWSMPLKRNLFNIFLIRESSMLYRWFLLIAFVLNFNQAGFADKMPHEFFNLYQKLDLQDKLSYEVFELSLKGFQKIKNEYDTNKSLLTIIDFSKPSTRKRLFIIDLHNKKLLYSSLVAHGRNSGEKYARKFSNRAGSLQSSLGFFITSNTYYGKHGYSLRLKGLEKSINDMAEKRTIVIHKADYVSRDFIRRYGRLGRSWGCPALPNENAYRIINLIKEGSCLFIYGRDKEYLKKSKYIR